MVDITQYCGGVCELIPPGYHLAMMPIQWVNSASASGVKAHLSAAAHGEKVPRAVIEL
jgi:hypothetical protein